jgi:hypothetical protein
MLCLHWQRKELKHEERTQQCYKPQESLLQNIQLHLCRPLKPIKTTPQLKPIPQQVSETNLNL